MITKKSQKSNQKLYNCVKCDYVTSNKFDWTKHKKTRKHKMITNDNNDNENDNTSVEYICNLCGKIYKYKSGLSSTRKIVNYLKIILLKKNRKNRKNRRANFV